MNKFKNFMTAECAAEGMARLEVGGNLAFVFIEARNAGNAYSDKEKKEAQQIYHQALRQSKRNHLERFIFTGRVVDCILSRRYMEHHTGRL